MSTGAFTAGLREEAEKYCAKCTAAVRAKCLAGGGPWEPILWGAPLFGLTPAKNFPALGKDLPAWTCQLAQASQASTLFQGLHE